MMAANQITITVNRADIDMVIDWAQEHYAECLKYGDSDDEEGRCERDWGYIGRVKKAVEGKESKWDLT